jgi:hypothetical protein
MKTTKFTPEQIDADLAAAEAEHARLADKVAAVREAGETTRAAVELQCIRTAASTLPKAAREARDQAAADLAAVANVDTLDLQALLTAFDRLLRLDGEAGAVRQHTGRLDRLDPLPPHPNGAERTRPPQCVRLHAGANFSDYVDILIARRADTAEANRLNQLRAELTETVDAAESTARQQAAELADGQRLQVDSPETIVEQYRRAIGTVNDDDLDPETIRGAGLPVARNVARQHALDKLLTEEAGN